jgi:hypothetical protein
MKSKNDVGSLNYTTERILAPRGPEVSCDWNTAGGRSRVEAAARAEFELRAGRPIGDAEWEAAKAQLAELARMLRRWRQETMTAVPGRAEAIAPSQGLPEAA